jgi:hypothetical protein
MIYLYPRSTANSRLIVSWYRLLDSRGTNPFGDSVILLEDSLKSPDVKGKLIVRVICFPTSPRI